MAQDDPYGGAQPIIDDIKGAYKKANDFVNKVPTLGIKPAGSGSSQPDTSWHDEMVKKANKSFADAQAADQKAAAAKKLPTQTMAQKRAVPAKPQPKMMTKVMPRKK